MQASPQLYLKEIFDKPATAVVIGRRAIPVQNKVTSNTTSLVVSK
jgi:hypothetical protein